jgi:hypothetical protein
MSRITSSFYTNTIAELVYKLNAVEDKLNIPSHQRNYVWDINRQRMLITSVLEKRALTGSILVRLLDSGLKDLEDGQQRLTTFLNFIHDMFTVKIDGVQRKFSELEPEKQELFLNTKIPVEQYANASQQEAIKIFIARQGGAPLTTGDKLAAVSELSPIVKFAVWTLMTNNQGLHERARAVWGSQCGADKSRKKLLEAVAICAAIAFGTQYMTKKWADFQTSGILDRPIDEEAIVEKLQKILTIYENVSFRSRIADTREYTKRENAAKKKLWQPAYVTAYIIHSLEHEGVERQDEVCALWEDFLVSARRDTALIERTLHADTSAARSWTVARWQAGFIRVIYPNVPHLLQEQDDVSDSDEQEEA